jgi:hypothetical protein
MTKTASPPQVGTIETILLNLDHGALGALYRVAIGFATVPATSLLLGNDVSEWTVVLSLLSVLLLLRIVPAVIRKLAPFSRPLREAWAARRRLAKQYDSYQWQKLIWIGVGLSLFTAVSGQWSPLRIVVCSVCVLAGAAGMATWHTVSAGEFARLREKFPRAASGPGSSLKITP